MPWFNRRRREPSREYISENPSAMLPRWTHPPERNAYDWMKTFSKSPRLAVVEKIASDLSFATGKLYVIDDNGEERELEKHSFLDFWENPNPLYEFSAASIWRLQEIYLLLKGEGYFVMERDAAGRPAELWPVPYALGPDDALPRAPVLHRPHDKREHLGCVRGRHVRDEGPEPLGPVPPGPGTGGIRRG